MYIEHRDMETGKLIHIIDTKGDLEMRGQLTEVVVMLPSGRKVRLVDAPEGVDGFDIKSVRADVSRPLIFEPQARNWIRIWFRQPTEEGNDR